MEINHLTIKNFREELGLSQKEFAKKLGVTPRTLQNYEGGKDIPESIQKLLVYEIVSHKDEINLLGSNTGEGDMLKSRDADKAAFLPSTPLVPLLPIAAQGGRLNDFVASVHFNDCEKIVSPIKQVDFAISVSGNSMSPEYPNGTKILIQKINEKAFIEWGKVYVLDTCNGTVIKEIHQGESDRCVQCVSINPDPKYRPFTVRFSDIYGMYKVLMSISLK